MNRQKRVLPDAQKNYWNVKDWPHAGLVRAYLHPNYDLGMHAHGFIEINFVVHGSGDHYLDEGVFPTSAGDVFVIPVNVRHGYGNSKRLNVFHLLLHPTFLGYYGHRLFSLPGFLPFFTVEPYFRKEANFRHKLNLDKKTLQQLMVLLNIIEQEAPGDSPERALVSESLALYVISVLCRCYREQNKHTGETGVHGKTQAFQRVFEFIENGFGRKISTASLAQAACMQRNYFCKTFRDCTGLSPLEYVNILRVQKAERMLLETSRSITHIAMDTGFYDSAHFSRTFSKITGISPKQYRK